MSKHGAAPTKEMPKGGPLKSSPLKNQMKNSGGKSVRG